VNAGPQPGQAPPPGPGPAPARRLPIPSVRPRLTLALILINVLVFALQYASLNTVGADLVIALGAKNNAAIAAGEFWRLLTPLFIHANLLHLFVNCYSLYVIGPQVEAPFGYVRFLVIYLLSGIAGVVLSFALSPSNSVGASGAIFGLVGALAEFLYRHRRRFGEFARQRLMNLLIIIGINLVFGLTSPQIDNWGHLGGLAGGVLLGWLIGPDLGLESEFAQQPRVIDRNPLTGRWLAVAAFVLALGAATSLVITMQR
jgi:rhomboid protease GluP